MKAQAKSKTTVARPKRRPEEFTARERQIVELVWSGLKNREIASRLKISVKTVEAHRATVMKKARVTNTAQLLKTALAQGIVQP
ncbi:LuxR C-terminal-related transcriptional regulator [Candidatus Nitrospira bockiana]